jgi:hypothetical protein
VVDFLLLHLCASNRYNVGLEALTADPRPKCFSMSLDGHTIVGISNELLQTAALLGLSNKFLEAAKRIRCVRNFHANVLMFHSVCGGQEDIVRAIESKTR